MYTNTPIVFHDHHSFISLWISENPLFPFLVLNCSKVQRWRQVYSLALRNRIRRLLEGGGLREGGCYLYTRSAASVVCVCVCVCLGIYPEHACPGGRWERVLVVEKGEGAGQPGPCLEQVSEVICHEEEEWREQLKCVGSIKGEGIHQGRICRSGRKKQNKKTTALMDEISNFTCSHYRSGGIF